MTLEFYEGGAGTGKTHHLVARATELIRSEILGETGRLLALTYMNGARHRLQTRLGSQPGAKGRLACQTFDTFARYVSGRRRSLLSACDRADAAKLDPFSGPCFLAGKLLQLPEVQAWVARSFPLIVVDEAQDLDEHRIEMLKGLAAQACVLAAADGFQCLSDGQNSEALMQWLTAAGTTHRLLDCKRTTQTGLLAAARALRGNTGVLAHLACRSGKRGDTWSGNGIRIRDTPATNSGIIGSAIAYELLPCRGATVILTPDTKDPKLKQALEAVQSRVWGQRVGPFPFEWELPDSDAANTLIGSTDLPERGPLASYRVALGQVLRHASAENALRRLERRRRLTGQEEFTREQVVEMIHDCVRDQSRFRTRTRDGRLAMTIHRAKNREFRNVVVLWPHSASADSEHFRRLLYNGVTRAMEHCSIVVIGQGRLDKPPFVRS